MSSDIDRFRELTAQYEGLAAKKKAADDEEKSRKEKMDLLESEILQLLVDLGLQNMKSETGFLFFRKKEQYVSMTPGTDKEAFLSALANAPQFADLVSRSYNTMALRSRYREVVESGEAVDDAVMNKLKVTEVTKLGVRKS